MLLVGAFLSFLMIQAAASGLACEESEDHHTYLPPGARDGQAYPVYVAFNWDMLSRPLDEYGLDTWPWIFYETNGEPGLQRADDYCHDTRADGTPYTPETADLPMF